MLKLVPELYHHGGLAVVRTLGRMGVPVYAVHDSRTAPAAFSRYGAGRFVYEGGDPVDFLRACAERIGRRTVLIPQDDVASVTVEDNADVLEEWFAFQRQPEGLVHRLTSKRGLAELSAAHDVPTPQIRFPRSGEELEAVLDELGAPIVFKGVESWIPGTTRGARLEVTYTRGAAVALWNEMDEAERSNLMLQEYIPGGPDSVWMFNGYFDAASDCLVGFTGRKLRQSPPYSGITSLGVLEDNEVVDEQTRRLMKGIGYRGVLDIGYRYDARDGLYKLLDANPRVGGTFRLFVDDETGMDVVRALYLDLTGQEVPAARQRSGRRWLLEPWDVRSCLVYRQDGRLTLRDWLRSLRGVDEGAWFARDDPLPFLVLCARLVGKAVSGGGKAAHA
jgi:predicted ATP-grasp superfamily ATP-dependent carboligase